MVNKKKNNSDDSIWSILTGLALGFSGLIILSFLKKPECPSCHDKLEKGVQQCSGCGANLIWKKKQ